MLSALSRSSSQAVAQNVAARSFASSTQVAAMNKNVVHGQDKDAAKETAFLILNDGTTFRGKLVGARRPIVGEVVFNTGMVGYPESLTDPSYAGQILTLTYPLVGNYGVPSWEKDKWGIYKHFESHKIHVAGLIMAEYSTDYAHWNAERSLHDWLKAEDIPAITGIDTRRLTQKLRSESPMLGKIIIDEDLPLKDPMRENLVAAVSNPEVRTYGNGKYKIIVVDCGLKQNMLRCLLEAGDVTLKVVPWDYPFANEDYDGLFISNGPGDPRVVHETINELRKCFERPEPIFGICMGNQLMSLAAGAKVYKLPFGNRGQNQPVIDVTTGRVVITSQNHGYAVDNHTLPPDWKPSFINANDGSNEGIMHRKRPFFSVQFHPEARGGPWDTTHLFGRFLDAVSAHRERRGVAFVPQRQLPKKVLLLGSGALQIGQAGEFDYSGSQAIKALKEEGVQTVLINPNIATVQTAKGVADQIYYLPVTTEFVEMVIAKERPDAIMLGFGGQTGLNTGLDLDRKGIFSKYNVRVLGTQVKSIEIAEDRDLFKNALIEINEPVAESLAVESLQDSIKAANNIGYPVIVRAAFSLGGLGSGFANNDAELTELVTRALTSANQVLVEKSLRGWKEVEYEVVRDAADNCITVCNMENFDPMGIHTGESIVVAPSQTLTNDEYHMLRTSAIRIVRHLGIVGECNVQYTLDPVSHKYYVIEVNPRLSRSSALASKATGYPLAFVAAKLGLGFTLPEIRNSVTKSTSACFEPSLDYIVTKIPRWDLDKFSAVRPQLGSQMKSVGEVMAIGRTFEESFQKALRMVHSGKALGFETKAGTVPDLDDELRRPTPKRVQALSEALDKGYSVEKLYELTRIDKWFLLKLQGIALLRKRIKETGSLAHIDRNLMAEAKKLGFSDRYLAVLVGDKEANVRQHRLRFGVRPVVKQIDTLAAEFPAKTNYLYMTYHDNYDDLPKEQPRVNNAAGADSTFTDNAANNGVMVLGSGTYRIGSSVEFDYCAVSCVRSLRRLGRKTIMVNYNPETVSTDYDESDRLYFEELSLERVLDIIEHEQPEGVVVSVGGQEAQNLALPLLHSGAAKILGTSPLSIDVCEDRYKFSQLCDQFGIEQPAWKELSNMQAAEEFANKVGYPVLVRPSYVLSGAAMKVAYDAAQLRTFLGNAADVSPDHPVVMTKFVLGARELELDAVARDGEIVVYAVSEHVEDAGVHSGDATHILPSDNVTPDVVSKVKHIGSVIAKALNISGPMNLQLLWKGPLLQVIECNLRASRSFPFVSKVYDIDFIETATRIFVGQHVSVNNDCMRPLPYVGVKAPQFSFQRIHGADPILGVEMASTGEVATLGRDKYEAFLKSYLSVTSNFRLSKRKHVTVSGKVEESFANPIKLLLKKGYKLHATEAVLKKLQLTAKDAGVVALADEQKVVDFIKNRQADLVINFNEPTEKKVNYEIRRAAVDFSTPLLTNEKVAAFMCEAISRFDKLPVESYEDFYARQSASIAAGATYVDI